ncbi:DNA topoisomerase 2 [Phyllosticta citricarpa]|uniref:DNA topoisomerase 2 n=2 Tax=Phyllosticta TaxID=121621 RepID=A0ABR1M2T7_9PEZI
MSSDDESVFQEDMSSEFEEAPKTKKAAPAKKAPAPKKATAKKPLRPIENGSIPLDGQNDDDSGDSQPDIPAKKPAKAPANATNKYQKLTQLEHILKRPDTYIGSVERDSKHMWVYNSETESMENREVSFVPGLYKIFDEILVNAADNKHNDPNMKEIKVTIDRDSGEISVRNDGKGIPIEIHGTEGIYIPELIFGHLLTSSNYDDDQQKVTGGRNGYGAKLCNIFSTEFTLETADSRVHQKYKQTWTDNMGKCGKAKITSHKGESFTKVTFKPDFRKFGMDGMDDDFEALAKRRVYDIAGTTKGLKVLLNGDRIKVKNFKEYMKMYTKAIKTEQGSSTESDVILTDNPNDRWEIGFAVSDGAFSQVSFVNSIATTSGGTHVNYIADQVVNKLTEIIKKKNKNGFQLKPQHLKNHLFLFVNCQIVNPAFTSQTKEQMTTKASQFGSKCTVSEKFLKDIAKTEVVNNILHFAQQKADQVLKKSDGAKRTRMNHSKLTDANRAGTKDGYRCTLILTEGDSASLLALAGRAEVDPDLFGVFPLRGKMLNVRDASIDQISRNEEIQNIKKFIGLQHKKEYTDTKGLRYGHIMIMTDQDHDGSHIKGLLINFLQVQFPSLLKIEGFLLEFITPIVKVWKGDPKKPKAIKSFFTMPEYEEWKQDPSHQRGWDHKYYKGLGTSRPEDAVEYFQDLDRHLKEFHTMKDAETELFELAFSKKKADARKEWLRTFVPGTFLDMRASKISYDDFVNKELILFSMVDNYRSIPSVVDGLKPGQRKVLYTCFKRNVRKDIKVIELAGHVGGMTNYAYGDASLQQTIVGLAQNFVGSNNINVLEPSGNFGSRFQGGSDAASARYIYTRLSPFARRIFHTTDEPLLTYDQDDGKTIEPTNYVPVLPMILVNGADGIGTGWSSSIPNYNPIEIVDNLKARMHGSSKEDMKRMMPWFRGWKGTIEDVGGDRYKFTGIIKKTGELEVEITELPIRVWTQDFKDKLEGIIKAEKIPSFIKDYNEYHTLQKVSFIIKMADAKNMQEALNMGLEERFKLYKPIATSNLVAFDAQGRIQKYATELDILEEFYHIRLKFYEKRKQYMLDEMTKELNKLTNQARFIQMIIDNKLVVSKKKKLVIVAELKKLGFDPISKNEAKNQGEGEDVVDEEDSEEDKEPGSNDYDYLLGMAIWSLTQERVEKLLRQIGDKETEIDELIKKSPKDLWTTDLDEFVEEWETQEKLAENEAKESRKKGRRASSKLKIGSKAPKKRKADDSDAMSDDDFEIKPKKKAVASKQSFLSGFMNKYPDSVVNKAAAKPKAAESAPKGKSNNMLMDFLTTREKKEASTTPMEIDGASDEPVTKKPISKPRNAAAKPAPKPIDVDDMSDGDDFAPEPAPKPKANARKAAPKKMVLSDESDGDDFEPEPEPAPKPRANARKAAPKKITISDDSDADDFEPEAEPEPEPEPAPKPKTNGRKAAPKKITISDDEEADDFEPEPEPQPKKAPAKKPVISDDSEIEEDPAPKSKAAAAKASHKINDDSDEDVFAAVAETEKKSEAPSRRRAAAKPTRYVLSDDSDEDMEDNDLGDVSTMIRGLDGPSMDSNGRTLFSASKGRATSTAFPKTTKSKPSPETDDDKIDDTDYTMLAPQASPQRTTAPRKTSANGASDDSADDNDSDDDVLVKPKSKAAASKPAAAASAAAKPRGRPPSSKNKAAATTTAKAAPKEKAKPGPKPKAKPAAAPVVEKKATQLSPAAKAYAKARPGRAAAAAAKSRYTVESDDDDEGDTFHDASDGFADEFSE